MRHAVYFSPDVHSPWWAFGEGWLGRATPAGDRGGAAFLPSGLPLEDRQALIRLPQRYGFHATLKAPMALHPEANLVDLVYRLQQVAARLTSVRLTPLRLAVLGDFMALVPNPADRGLRRDLHALEAACVKDLDDLRAPMGADERARRMAGGLDPQAVALMDRWGYPWVLDRFRLHFTLTGPAHPDQLCMVARHLEPEVNRLNTQAPLVLDRLCLYTQAEPDAAFVRTLDVPFMAPAEQARVRSAPCANAPTTCR